MAADDDTEKVSAEVPDEKAPNEEATVSAKVPDEKAPNEEATVSAKVPDEKAPNAKVPGVKAPQTCTIADARNPDQSATDVSCVLDLMGLSSGALVGKTWSQCEGLAQMKAFFDRRSSLLAKGQVQSTLNFVRRIDKELDILLEQWILLRTANPSPECTSGSCEKANIVQSAAVNICADNILDLQKMHNVLVSILENKATKLFADKPIADNQSYPFDTLHKFSGFPNKDLATLSSIDRNSAKKNPMKAWQTFQNQTEARLRQTIESLKAFEASLQEVGLYTLALQSFAEAIQKRLQAFRKDFGMPTNCSLVLPTAEWTSSNLDNLAKESRNLIEYDKAEASLKQAAIVLQKLILSWNNSGPVVADRNLRVDLLKDFSPNDIVEKLNQLSGDETQNLAQISRAEVDERFGPTFQQKVQSTFGSLSEGIRSRSASVGSAASAAQSKAKEGASALGTSLSTSIRSRSSSIGSAASAAQSKAKEGTSSFSSSIRSRSASVSSATSEKFKQAKEAVIEGSKAVGTKIQNAFSGLETPQWLTKISKSFKTKKTGISDKAPLTEKLAMMSDRIEEIKSMKASKEKTEQLEQISKELTALSKEIKKSWSLIKSKEEAEIVGNLIKTVTSLLEEAKLANVKTGTSSQELEKALLEADAVQTLLQNWTPITQDSLDLLKNQLQAYMNKVLKTDQTLSNDDIQPLIQELSNLPTAFTRWNLQEPTVKDLKKDIHVQRVRPDLLVFGAEALQKPREGPVWTLSFSITVFERPISGNRFKTVVGGSLDGGAHKTTRFKWILQVGNLDEMKGILDGLQI